MIDEETRRKLREMSMGEIADALDLQDSDRTCMAMPFEERVRMMVDHAYEEKRASSVKMPVHGGIAQRRDRGLHRHGQELPRLLHRQTGL